MFQLKIREAVVLLLYAIPNTLLSFGIIHIINKTLAGDEAYLKDYMIIVFLVFVGYAYLLNVLFQKYLNQYSFKVLYENEKEVFGQILNAPLSVLEKHGSQRFYTTMEDLRVFSNLPITITHTVTSLLMLLLGVIYMYTLSVTSASIVIVVIALVAACYFLVMNSMATQVGRLRKYNEQYYHYVRDLIAGFKELKLSLARRTNLKGNYLDPNRDAAEKLDFRINYTFLSINLISQYGLYVAIAAILFGLPALGFLDREGVIAYVVVLLFISGPINNLVNLQRMYTRFIVANRRIKEFMKDFEADERTKMDLSSDRQEFSSLHFKNVAFAYESAAGKNTFTLGPLDLEIKKGEVLFVVGGNGSGKSTFINLLTGLYVPTGGEIILNAEKPVNIQEHLHHAMAAVFTDNHLFSYNYEDYALEKNARYCELLGIMKLNEVIKEDNEEAARRTFSKGQSKRMSMIFALLEKKPILVLDEWAADQDPYFRKYFYEELLPPLKKEGKTIIAVTHDDAYFHKADRIIKFDYGQIVTDIDVNSKMPLTESLWS